MIKNYLRITAAAFVGLVLTSSAFAATTAYSPDNLFLGFTSNAAGVTQDYLINIGPAATYWDLAPGAFFNLAIGNYFTDLAAIFGSTWFSDPNVRWGVVGTPGASGAGGDPANTLNASRAENHFRNPVHVVHAG